MAWKKRRPTPPLLDDTPLFDQYDLQMTFPPAVLERALSYVQRGAVVDVQTEFEGDGQTVMAAVQGSEPEPYEVEIEVTPCGGIDLEAAIYGECSCPAGINCKHVAAALLKLLHDFAQNGNPPGEPAAPVPAAAPRLPAPPLPPRPDPLAGPLGYWVRELVTAVGPQEPPKIAERILYLFDLAVRHDGRPVFTVRPVAVKALKKGGWGGERPYQFPTLAQSVAKAVAPEDNAIGRLYNSSYSLYGSDELPSDPTTVDLVVDRAVATGRARWRTRDSAPLTLGPARPGRVAWMVTEQGDQCATVEAEDPDLVALPAASPWYVDPANAVCGPLAVPGPRTLVPLLMRAPPVAPDAARAVIDTLRRQLPELPFPPPRDDIVEDIVDDPPVPCLRFSSEPPVATGWYARPSRLPELLDLARLSFDYGGTTVDPATPPADLRRVRGGRVSIRRRRPDAERLAAQTLHRHGLTPPNLREPGGYSVPRGALILQPASAERWVEFMHKVVPTLRAAGWRIDYDDNFRHRVIVADGDWDARIDERGSGWWFSLDLGIEVQGERIPLLPVLVDALRRLRDPTAPGALEQLAANGTVFGRLPDGRVVVLPFDRVRALLGVLVELFDAGALRGGTGLDLSLAQAAGLEAIAEATRLRWIGGQRLRAMAESLRGSGAIAALPPPAGLRASLRPYQREGYSWLQFLASHELGGILADDMGLGKTLQTLAHLLAEKEAGRLVAPALVVCPTSLVPNWRAEAARFAPDLRVLVLHGPARAKLRADIGESDLVITTYALLVRDEEELTEVDWHAVILDEAQAIKNPAAKATQAACRLNARHRLCLSGTPVENHLGEAWSQFAFLMPGLLGDSKTFTRVFRTPIEKRNDAERRQLLARRLKPFLLRRTKAEVAAELPPKTEIVRRLELSGEQRDLYETLRLAMHERVRQEVAAKGLARSHILILDALLKLRQVCCDPRLVKLKQARSVHVSAKLEHLMDLLPTMVEDGRRVLLFSQFTSMLDLIGPVLKREAIPFVELRGDTVDRAAPVAAFQEGRVPVFLVSLKAGGVGLNLTAADTVIHYDPWWNPAVEDQATDRAHRIGQDKPVFVYKLITSGTVEERMLELQERKRDLAGALFDPDAAGKVGFDEADLDLLFQPLA